MRTFLKRHQRFATSIVISLVVAVAPAWVHAQQEASAEPPSDSAEPPSDSAGPPSDSAGPPSEEPSAEVEQRLERTLHTTGWFDDVSVRFDEGVLFLSGVADSEEHRDWASQLAEKSAGVVAVVNQIKSVENSDWDLSGPRRELHRMLAEAWSYLPILAVAFLLLVTTMLVARASVTFVRRILHGRLQSQLLRNVAARAASVPIFVAGLYLVLRISGLTRLAVTVLGGTGLIGLVLGFAFRDIAENFLASLLISLQRPFASGDLVEVAGHTGYVQSVNTRATLLMTLEGNHVQIPNATVYKDTITNFTANPNARFDFAVGIGYEDSLAKAQSVALDVLRKHPAVVPDPEPLVLVEELGASTVNLRVYFWINISRYSHYKVRSAVVRMTKKAFELAGISMPDEAREVIFPKGVPVVQGLPPQSSTSPQSRPMGAAKAVESDDELDIHSAEGGLESEAGEIQAQAKAARKPEEGEDLLS